VGKEILRSGQLNIELSDEEVAAFRQIYADYGLTPNDIVRALIRVKIAEYRQTGELTFRKKGADLSSDPVRDVVPGHPSHSQEPEEAQRAVRTSTKTPPTAPEKRGKP
jgi:hypothetical protein